MDWLHSRLPICLQWRRHQADTQIPTEPAGTEEETHAASRLLDALGGGTTAKPAPAIPTADAFVDICVQAVQHEVKHKRGSEELETLENHALSLSNAVDVLTKLCADVAARDLPELADHLEEIQQNLSWKRETLQTRLEQIEMVKDSLSTSERALTRLLGRLYSSSQPYIDASEAPGKIGTLEGTYLLCHGIRRSATLKAALDRTQVQTKTCQQAYINASRALRDVAGGTPMEEREKLRRSWQEAKGTMQSSQCRLDLQKKELRRYESEMLLDCALPILVKQGLYPAPFSPTNSSNGADLRFVEDGERQRKEFDNIHLVAGQGREVEAKSEVLHRIIKTRRNIGKAQRRLEQKRKARLDGLVSHLSTFPNATIATFDAWYTAQNNGRSFLQSRTELLQWIEKAQRRHARLQARAENEGLEDVPLSPTSFADRTDDDDNSSIEQALNAGETRGGISNQRALRRWQRRIARDFGSSSRSSSRTPPSAGLASPSDFSEVSADDGKRKAKWLKRHKQKMEALRLSGKGRELQTDEDKQREARHAQEQLVDASTAI